MSSYGPQYHQPQYQPYPPQPPKKKSGAGKIVLFVFLGFLALCVGGGVVAAVAGGGGSSGDTAAAAPEKKAAGIGQPVRDGKFEFTVKSVKCGTAQVGTEYLNKDAQGQFCLVAVTVKNIGDKAQLFDSSSQKAYNAAGQEYAADGEAAIYVNSEAQTFLEQINPGNSVEGTLVWDIPKGQELAKLELHDSPFSGGVDVNL